MARHSSPPHQASSPTPSSAERVKVGEPYELITADNYTAIVVQEYSIIGAAKGSPDDAAELEILGFKRGEEFIAPDNLAVIDISGLQTGELHYDHFEPKVSEPIEGLPNRVQAISWDILAASIDFKNGIIAVDYAERAKELLALLPVEVILQSELEDARGMLSDMALFTTSIFGAEANNVRSTYSYPDTAAVARLRREGRIHGFEAYRLLEGNDDGISLTNRIPPLTDELVRACETAPLKSMLVLVTDHALSALDGFAAGDYLTDPKFKYGQSVKFEISRALRLKGFIDDTELSHWAIVPMEPYTDGFNHSKDYALEAAAKEFGSGENKAPIVLPTAHEVAVGIILHYAATKELLFPGLRIRVAEEDAYIEIDADAKRVTLHAAESYGESDGVSDFDRAAITPVREYPGYYFNAASDAYQPPW